jgi:hypothetical protein
MEKGNWIEMTWIPLIAAEGAAAEGGAAEDVEGGGTAARRGVEQGAEGDAEQDTETARGEGQSALDLRKRINQVTQNASWWLSMLLSRPVPPPKLML